MVTLTFLMQIKATFVRQKSQIAYNGARGNKSLPFFGAYEEFREAFCHNTKIHGYQRCTTRAF